MGETFKDVAGVLFSNGFEPLPVGGVTGKAPLLEEWQLIEINKDAVSEWMKDYARCSTGVRCGVGEQPIYGVDIDITNKAMSELVSSEVLKRFGEAPIRIGRAPKSLLVYTGKAGVAKLIIELSDRNKEQHKIEILGAGQQFVAYGIHKDTKKPYAWVGEGLVDIEPWSLNNFDHNEFMAWFRTELKPLIESKGWSIEKMGDVAMRVPDGNVDELDVILANQPKDISEEEVVAILSAVPQSMLDDNRDAWRNIGLALHHQYGGSEQGRLHWVEVSKRSVHFDEKELNKDWRSFKSNTSKPYTMLSLRKAIGDMGGITATPDAFDLLVKEAEGVNSLEQYDSFSKKVRSMSEHLLPSSRRDILIQEVYEHFGVSNSIGKMSIKKEMSFNKKKSVNVTSSENAPAWLEGWVYVENACLFAKHDVSDYMIKKEAFNAKYDRELECVMAERQASSLALVDYKIKTVAGSMFFPKADRFFTYEGKEMLNSFTKQGCEPCDVLDDDGLAVVEMFKKHIAFTLEHKEEQTLLINWLAYVYQNPGKRVAWAMLLQGAQGTGKSFFGNILEGLMGSNVRSLDTGAISNRFTGWAHGALVNVVEEIRISGTSKYDILDKLKPIISNQTIQVEFKGLDHVTVPNFTSYLLLTNHKDAVPIQDGDRRYCCLFSKIQSEEQLFREFGGREASRVYFDRLFDESRRRIDAIARFLLDWNITKDFDPNGRAPETSARIEMKSLSVSHDRDAIENAIEKHRCRVIGEQLIDITYLNKLAKAEGDELPQNFKITTILSAMGYSPIKDRRVKVYGEGYHYVWEKGKIGKNEEIIKSFFAGEKLDPDEIPF